MIIISRTELSHTGKLRLTAVLSQNASSTQVTINCLTLSTTRSITPSKGNRILTLRQTVHIRPIKLLKCLQCSLILKLEKWVKTMTSATCAGQSKLFRTQRLILKIRLDLPNLPRTPRSHLAKALDNPQVKSKIFNKTVAVSFRLDPQAQATPSKHQKLLKELISLTYKKFSSNALKL